MFADMNAPITWDNILELNIDNLQSSVRRWLMSNSVGCLRHPHGFYIIFLGRTGNEEWRLHFWPKGSRIVTGMPAFIHTHNCHVESRILKGKVTNILYDVVVDSNGDRPLYRVDYDGDRYKSETSNKIIKTDARVNYKIKNKIRYLSGDYYRVERNEYHEALVNEDECVSTFVCMSGRTADSVMVVGVDGYPQIISFTRAECHSSDFAEWF